VRNFIESHVFATKGGGRSISTVEGAYTTTVPSLYFHNDGTVVVCVFERERERERENEREGGRARDRHS